MRNITIKWDEQDRANEGWSYDIAEGESGAIDGQAADAIDRICENMSPEEGDHAAIVKAIGAKSGDQVWLDRGPGSLANLAGILGLDNPAAILGAKGGSVRSAAKTAAVRANGAKGGRPNVFQADDGRDWRRVKIVEGPSCMVSSLYWQCTEEAEDEDGNDHTVLHGLFDDDGEKVTLGNCAWRHVRSVGQPSWW